MFTYHNDRQFLTGILAPLPGSLRVFAVRPSRQYLLRLGGTQSNLHPRKTREGRRRSYNENSSSGLGK